MELKKCPFCGAEAKVNVGKAMFEALVEENGNAAVSIGCINRDCGVEYWCFSTQHHSKDYEEAKQIAIERWNHRAEVQESESV
jgi:hypothetical protein